MKEEPEISQTDRPHAERSASQLKSLVLCPAYRPDNDTKKKQHWVTEQGLRGHDSLETGDTGDLESDFEERMVKLCQDYSDGLPKAEFVLEEVRVETIEDRWGYFDRIRFRSPTEADLLDWKFVRAKRPEDAEINLQGKDYVIGVFEKYPNLQKIHVHFVAPRFEFVTFHTFERGDVERLKLEIFAILTQARKTDRKRHSKKLHRPHYDTCRFCSIKGTCPAIRKIATEVYNKYIDEGAEPLPEVPDNVHSSQVDDVEDLGRLKILAGVMESWASSVNHHTTDKALEAGKVPKGFEITYRKARRKLSKPLALLSLDSKFGLTVADVLEASNVSVHQLEKIVMARAEKGKKERTKNDFLDSLRDLDVLHRGEETPTLTKKIEK